MSGRHSILDSHILRFTGAEIASRRRECGFRIERGEADCSVAVISYLYFQLQCGGVRVDRCGVVSLADRTSGALVLRAYGDVDAARMIRLMGRAIHDRRGARGMTLGDVVRRGGIHRNSLWSMENGIITPSLSTCFRVLRALDVAYVTASQQGPVFV